jgi:hypothetical protein
MTTKSQKANSQMKKMRAQALKYSHILTNRQRREIITYKNEADRVYLIWVFHPV